MNQRPKWASLEESKRHTVLSTSTQGAYDRALELDADERRELRDALARFVRFHGFLGQVVPYLPVAIEVLFQFSKVLLKRLMAVEPRAG